LIYHLNKNDDAPMNLRANFSQTVARPSIRELSGMAVYDYTQRYFIVGNPNLKQVQINNYDLRYEWYFKNKDYFSAGGFYKDFTNHIELVNTNGSLTWRNADKSYVVGLELEGKKNIIKNLDFTANITFVSSKSTYLNNTHPMFGQAPYIINAILSYNLEKYGLIATLSYNTQGKRLSLLSDNASIPNIYEMPRNMFDFKVMKKLGKHFTVSVTIRDILNTSIRRAYIYADGTKIDYDKFRYGTNYVVSLAYKL
jgi:outer membrane receptor protein involved in Fe transport